VSTYIIGDIQGCYDAFSRLLEKVRYDSAADALWLAGDMINRGPDNVGVMELIMQLPHVTCVLGNHDLHFLAVAFGQQRVMRSDTFSDLLDHPRRSEYVEYLLRQPLIHHAETANLVMVHAGLPPQLDLPTCLSLAAEVEAALQADDPVPYFASMYGNEPPRFDDHLTGMERLRVITNGFTRIRYCKADGELELSHKGDIQPEGYSPWFSFERKDDLHILFGHWAALEGRADASFVTALDTGCVWGRHLTALRLEDRQLITVEAS
jgi:bis(5'-nucleosyl)-tetraphosphatase (symmetrical)